MLIRSTDGSLLPGHSGSPDCAASPRVKVKLAACRPAGQPSRSAARAAQHLGQLAAPPLASYESTWAESRWRYTATSGILATGGTPAAREQAYHDAAAARNKARPSRERTARQSSRDLAQPQVRGIHRQAGSGTGKVGSARSLRGTG